MPIFEVPSTTKVTSDIAAATADKLSTEQLGTAEGPAMLDSNGQLMLAELPISVGLFILEVSGAYSPRPNYSGIVVYVGPDAPTDAIANLDLWFKTTS